MSRDVKVVTEISKEGNGFQVKRIRPKKTTINKLMIGEECEIETIKGDKVKVSKKTSLLLPNTSIDYLLKVNCQLDGGKVVASGEKYNFCMEMIGGKLKETITFKGHTMSRISAKE